MEFFQQFNWIDNVFLAILVVSAFTGLIRGAVRELVSLISWLVGYIVAASLSRPLAKLFAGSDLFGKMAATASESLGSDASSQTSMFAIGVCFVVLFSVTVFLGTLAGRIINEMVEGGGISFLNRFAGIFFGLARGYLASLVLIFIVQLTPMSQEEVWQQSKIRPLYNSGVHLLSLLVQPSVDQIKKRVNTMDTPVPL